MSYFRDHIPLLLFVAFIVLLRIELLMGDKLEEFRTDFDPDDSVRRQQSFWFPVDLRGPRNYTEEGRKYLRRITLLQVVRLGVGVAVVLSLALAG